MLIRLLQELATARNTEHMSAVNFCSKELTYKQLWEYADQFAEKIAVTLGHSDIKQKAVGIFLPRHYYHDIFIVAAAKYGFIYVPLDYNCNAQRLREITQAAELSLLIYADNEQQSKKQLLTLSGITTTTKTI